MLAKSIVMCILIIAAGRVLAETQEVNQEPAELKKLRESYNRQVEQVINPIRAQYISQLDILQKAYTRQGDLKVALAVQNEIEKLRSESSGKAELSTSGHIRIKVRIDGSDKLLVRGKELWIQHIGADRPKDISIDGRKWNPVWDGNETRHFDALVTSFRPLSKATVKLKKWKGRGSVVIDEYPSEENENTLIIAIDDKENGAADYEIAVSW